MNKNNNGESKKTNDNTQEPRISFRFNNNVRELPLSKFDMIVYREVMKLIDNTEIQENLNSEKSVHSSNVNYWTKEYNYYSTQAYIYGNLIKQLEKDLKINKQAQPRKNLTCSVNQNVNIYLESDQSKNMNVDPEIIEISDNEIDQSLNKNKHSTNSMLVDKKQETKCSSINLVGVIEECQKLKVKHKIDPKSKTSNVTPNDNINNNCNNKALPINFEACTSLNKETCLLTCTCKCNSGSKSKTMLIDDKINCDDVNYKISTFVDIKDKCKKNCNPDIKTSGSNKNKREKSFNKTNNQNILNIKIPKLAKTGQESAGLHLKKSESRNATPIYNINNNCNIKSLLINVEACTSLNRKTCLSTLTLKHESAPKPMFVNNEINSDDVNEGISTKIRDNKICDLSIKNCEKIHSKTDDQSIINIKIPELPKTLQYPPPFPVEHLYNSDPSWKNELPAPILDIKDHENKVILYWDMKLDLMMAKINMFELFVCRETNTIPNSSMWIKVGDIKVDKLPMKCDLNKCIKGCTYYFALRAIDIHKRKAPFTIKKIIK